MKKLFSILMLVLLASITMAQSISKTINVATAGALSSLLTTTEKTTSTDLVVTGNIDARDVKCMRDEMTKLTNLDMSGVSIQAYTGSDGTSPNGSLTYPANEMPAYSFYNNIYGDKTLTNIKLPTSLTSIGEYAFRQCYRLTGSLTIPNSVTTIGGYAFQNCFSLTGSLIIPGAVTFIGDNAFSGTGFIVINSLCVTPPSLKSTSFSLPLIVYVPSLGLAAYKAAYLWRDYTIVAEKKVIINNPTAGSLAATLIGAGYGPLSSITHLAVTGNLNGVDIAQMKTNMTQLSDIDLTGATLENNILPANAFAEKAVLSYVKLPSSLTIIGSRAFSGCTGLSGELPITPLISSIGDSAFYNCRSLSGGVTLSNGITSIGSYAFYNCNNLHGSLSISNSVKSIGNYAFYRCGLTGSLNIPSFVTSIGDNAFYGCASFTGDLTLSNSLLTIGDLAVCGCYGFSGAISFPSTVTSIGNYAFSGCTTLTELNFSKNTSSINDYAFNNCTGVTKITVPRTAPPTIYTNTFGGINKETCSLIVPTGSSLSYQTANYWSLFIQVSEKAMADSYGLTIQVGSNGTITENNAAVGNGSILTASIGGTKTFTFTPDSGYEIATLTYNGNDVKSQISNNQYTTPAINANATLSVTFKKVQYRLALKSAESGTINLLCDYGATPSFDFTPSSGWSINTVKYNGGDVTASLANGVYTVPSLTGSALLSVSFEIPTNLRSASYSSVKVYTTDNEIVVEGTEPGENVAFYTIGGAFIQSVQSKGERILLLVPQGATYLVKTDSKTVKVAL